MSVRRSVWEDVLATLQNVMRLVDERERGGPTKSTKESFHFNCDASNLYVKCEGVESGT
jgi:hypothetical protein